MAFAAGGLARVDVAAKAAAGSLWIYTTADAAATVETANYFDDVLTEMADNDVVLVISTNATPFVKFYRVANSGTHVTLGVKVALA